MSQVYSKVEIPSNSPDELIELGLSVINKHTTLAANSPLKDLDLAGIKERIETAQEKRREAKDLHEKAAILNLEANMQLGIDATQNSKTEGTVLNVLTSARDILLGKYRGFESKLTEWGFKVLMRTSTRKKKSPSK